MKSEGSLRPLRDSLPQHPCPLSSHSSIRLGIPGPIEHTNAGSLRAYHPNGFVWVRDERALVEGELTRCFYVCSDAFIPFFSLGLGKNKWERLLRSISEGGILDPGHE